MDVALRGMLCLLVVLVTTAAASPSADPPAKLPADKPADEYADPKATYRTYIEAVRKNDVKAAKQCWVIDDDNKSGALDTIVGLWISMRQINQVAEKSFGAKGLDTILKGWRRDDVTDPALDLTKKRLDDAEVKINGDTAELKIKWKEDDGVPNPAFEFGESTSFRKVGGNWKIDANKMTSCPKGGADFFEKGAWGRMFRDQVAIMNEAIDGMEKNKLKTMRELGVFIEGKLAAMKKKYEEERKKEAPKGK
jgi:hypothetical protein